MPELATLRIVGVPITHPHAQRLIDEVQAEYVVRYGGPDETPLDPTVFDPPRGRFFVGYLGDEPVATGAWRRRQDVERLGLASAAEVKRMYVVPRARRRGHSRTMLAHLETTAAADGARVMVLETGIMQPEAIALYESTGYARVEGFGHYRDHPGSRYYAKPLADTTT